MRPSLRLRGCTPALCARARAAVRPAVRASVRKREGYPSLTSYMALPEKACERLQDVCELEPTSNGELRDRWGMDSGKDVARYLRDELGEYTYRDDDSRIRAVDGAPVADETDGDDDSSETGAVTHESGGEGQADPDPSESNESPEERESTAGETPSGRTLDLQPVEGNESGGETGGTPADTGSPGGKRMELPDDPVTNDRSSGLRPADGSGGGSDETKPECPECGDVLFEGPEFTAMLNDAAQRDKSVRRFLKANEGAAPELACRDIVDCGYYVENGAAHLFDSPSAGWGMKLALGAGAVAAAGLMGLASREQSGGGDDGILGGADDRVV